MLRGRLLVVVVVLVLLSLLSFIQDVGRVLPPRPESDDVWRRGLITVQWTPEENRGLGNQLFCFAALLGLARRHHNMTALIPRFMKIFSIFDLDDFAHDEHMEKLLTTRTRVKERYSRTCRFDPRLTAEFDSNYVIINGYFQSWRYFHEISAELRRTLVFRPAVLHGARTFLASLGLPATPRGGPGGGREGGGREGGVLLVAVHVRRGDLATGPRFIDYGYTVPPASYFNKAFTFYHNKFPRHELHFIVFTNDPSWARDNLATLDRRVYFSEGASAGVDLAAMSLCDHVIVSTGSYGWWAAWLAGGTTVYYKHWPRPHSKLDHIVNKTEYFPPAWTALD